MLVYRLCRAVHSKLDGEGALRYGGRWNSHGVAVVYTSSSLSLAIVETRVHLIRMPVDYMALAIDVPDAMFDPVVLEAGI